MISRLMISVPQWLWKLLLVSLPITSFPLVASVARGSTVNPLSAIPLALLLLLWLPKYLLDGGRLTRLALPLLLFLGIALLASALSLFTDVHPFLGTLQWERTLRGLVTLVVGVGFYLVAASFPKDDSDLKSTLLWLYIGGTMMLIWSTLQIVLVSSSVPEIPARIQDLHRIFSLRDMTTSRVSGFAYEPSWLANQLVVLYLPLWLGSAVRGYSVFSQTRTRRSGELVLFIWGAAVLMFSLSRIGFLSFFAILVAVILLVVAKNWHRSDGSLVLANTEANVDNEKKRSALRGVLVVVLIALVSVIGVAGALFFGAQFDSRIARVFEIDYTEILASRDETIYQLANNLAFAERLTYWVTAFRVFSEFPVLGVGIGNAGFFFVEKAPAFGFGLPEIIYIVLGEASFPNAKNLWIRLLAETGIIGFLTFLSWLAVTARAAWVLHGKSVGVRAAIGTAGLFALIAQIFEGFSLDTFALPQMWIMFGLIAAAFTWIVGDSAEKHSNVEE